MSGHKLRITGCKAHPLFPYNNNHFHQILQTVFSEYTEVITTSLVPQLFILPVICAFVIGFSCTVWTIMRSLAGH